MEAVKLSDGKDVYEIPYNMGEVDGETITATFTNPENSDISVYQGSNDGKFIVTVGLGYTGEADVTIEGSEGGEIEDTVTFAG